MLLLQDRRGWDLAANFELVLQHEQNKGVMAEKVAGHVAGNFSFNPNWIPGIVLFACLSAIPSSRNRPFDSSG